MALVMYARHAVNFIGPAIIVSGSNETTDGQMRLFHHNWIEFDGLF